MSPRRRRASRRWRRGAEVAVAAAMALCFLVAGALAAYDLYVLASRGIVVQADVIGVSSGRNSVLTVQFATLTGEVVRADTSNYRDVDDSTFVVDVVYDPRHPTRMQAANWGWDYVQPGYLVVAGLAFGWLAVQTHRHGLPDWLAPV